MKVYRNNGALRNLMSKWNDPEYQRWFEQEANRIESLTPGQIEKLLKDEGIKQSSRNNQDFESAKEIVFRGIPINSYVYQDHIKVITDYLGI